MLPGRGGATTLVGARERGGGPRVTCASHAAAGTRRRHSARTHARSRPVAAAGRGGILADAIARRNEENTSWESLRAWDLLPAAAAGWKARTAA